VRSRLSIGPLLNMLRSFDFSHGDMALVSGGGREAL
jgi:hypothetical protein